jgi:hypothetical protein
MLPFSARQRARLCAVTTDGPGPLRDRLEIRNLGASEELVVFRLVKSADRRDSSFVDSFRSNGDLGKPAVGREERLPELHHGISVFKTPEQAADRRRRIIDRLVRQGRREDLRIGDYIARLRLVGSAFPFEDRNSPDGHMTVWGAASRLAAAVVDISPAEPEDATE